MSTAKGGERSLSLEVRAMMSERPDEPTTVVAYAFSQGGALLDKQSLGKDGSTRLTVPIGAEPQSVRIMLGPEIDAKQLDAGELLRRGAIDRHVAVRPNLQDASPVIFQVGSDRLRHWFARRCVVNGTLFKSVVSGGVSLRLPVCRAEVDIYEVDPWPRIIFELPELDLARLREVVVGPWPPIDWPIPPRDLGEMIDDPIAHVALNPQPLPPRSLKRVALSKVAQPMLAARAPALPADLLLAARAARPVFESAVIANLNLLRPLLCWLFPLRVRKTKLVTVMTDDCGHFHAEVWRSIFNPDQPDLYFIARQMIWPGFWVTIYEPTPVACNTWWNYACGSEISLVTSHPFAHACPPCAPVIAPNNWVLFMAIGNTSVWRIHGSNDSTRVGAPGHDADKFGLLDNSAPWGGSLRPRLEFDSSLRSTLGVRYYRVSYKRASEPESAWRPSTEAINRHYTHEVAGDLILEQYALGPQTVGASAHLCEIPPALPPIGQWSIPNAVLDTQNALIPTQAVAPGTGFDASGAPAGADQGGLWQIGVELFDSAGTQVDPEALGIKWRVPMSDTLDGTIQTRDAAFVGLVDAVRNRMVVTVRVDNNPAFARIDAASVGGNAAADECGVMSYASRALAVDVPFLALQRNRFANYSFYVQRGAVTPPEYSVAGTAAVNATLMPAALPSSPPADAPPTVDTLLDGCTLAGFTEQLDVAHMATDGWSRQVQYDDSAARAFVLAPAGGS